MDTMTARQNHEMSLSKEEILKELEKARKTNMENFAALCEEAKKNEKLKNDLRLCADGLIPDGMVGGIVETEREKRHKAEKENKKLKKENKELQEHYDNSIHTDWIAEAAGEDAEDYRNVCCADTLGKMIKENKKLKEGLAQKFYKHYDEMDYDKMYIAKTVGPDLGKMVDHLMEENKKLKEAQR